MKPTNLLEDPRVAATMYVVEATHEEQHALWREYSEEAWESKWGTPPSERHRRVDWESDSLGWGHVVGKLAGFPVAIVVSWARIAGGLVMFWEATSRVVDYDMCKDWLEQHVPAYSKRHTNVANFGHCLAYMEAK